MKTQSAKVLSVPPTGRLDPHRLRRRMVESIQQQGITDEAVLQALMLVPRHLFVDEALAGRAYELTMLPIGLGQTISHPYTVAHMSQLLSVQPGMRVLEIGTGSGYQTAILASLGCCVYTIERLAPLQKRAQALFASFQLQDIYSFLGDGTLGYAPAAPYQRILVTAGGPIVPDPLLSQLDDGGIMLIPVGERPRSQRLYRIRRNGASFSQEDCGPAGFVDLVGDHGW